jgi:hypothetical protein
MYKNPLNNGVVSDYNSLKKQRDNGATVKKYESIKLKTKPNELQKYYQYLTYQQPILDELNYVAERMRTEDIKTKTDDYNFIEDLKIKREKQMKENSTIEKDISKDTLFDTSSEIKQDDPTPIINTDVELEIINQPVNIEQAIVDIFGDDEFNFSIADTLLINNEKFELTNSAIEKQKAKEERSAAKKAEIEANKAVAKAKKEEKAAEKKAAALKIREEKKAAIKAAREIKKKELKFIKI